MNTPPHDEEDEIEEPTPSPFARAFFGSRGPVNTHGQAQQLGFLPPRRQPPPPRRPASGAGDMDQLPHPDQEDGEIEEATPSPFAIAFFGSRGPVNVHGEA
jgi:hypothetical protein